MRIIDGINQLRGSPAIIPDCGRDDLPQFFIDMGYKVGVEIGTLRGEYTEKLCQPGLKIYTVDPYQNYRNYRRHHREEPYDVMYTMAMNRLSLYDCTIIKKTSMDAVEGFDDESIDFVYIDGNHVIRYVVEDIYEWNRKLKSGGTMSGHDYGRNVRSPYSFQALHVIPALNAMIDVLGIKNWYILGEHKPPEGEHRDKWRSWFWIKA